MSNAGNSQNPIGGPCRRCGNDTGSGTTSFFNTEWICLDCQKREKEHPAFAAAHAAEAAAVKSGNFNFPGVGCPPDLYLKVGQA